MDNEYEVKFICPYCKCEHVRIRSMFNDVEFEEIICEEYKRPHLKVGCFRTFIVKYKLIRKVKTEIYKESGDQNE